VRERQAARGYALIVAAAAMFGLNGSMARSLIDGGLSPVRLAQLRSLGSLAILVAVLLLTRRALLRVERWELPALAFLGVAGLALVHATYFLAIDRLEIGVAVTIQYLAPLLVLAWLAVVHGRRLGGGLWAAGGLSIAGCFFVVEAYRPGELDALGVAFSFAAAVTFAIYMVGSERAGTRHEPVTTLVWAFAFASAFWAVVTPWWSFPFVELDTVETAALALGVIVVGTLLPFLCIVAAVRHVPASRAAVVATLEPVLAALFASVFHDEALAAGQLAGGALVLAAVAWVQARRIDLSAELAPPLGGTRPGAEKG
jgi:drug/metabolite transporter (DMT)-like permease